MRILDEILKGPTAEAVRDFQGYKRITIQFWKHWSKGWSSKIDPRRTHRIPHSFTALIHLPNSIVQRSLFSLLRGWSSGSNL